VPGEVLIGIFWLVRGDDGQLAMPMRACLLREAEEYGDCLTFGDGHYETWEAWRGGRSDLDPALHLLRRAVSLSEYEEWPRGRVVHERTPSPRFVIYADKQAFPHHGQIVEAFCLPPELTRMRTDAHYRSTKRIACPLEGAAR